MYITDSDQQQVVAQLGIDIELFLRKLDAAEPHEINLSERDKRIVCQFLLGNRRPQIANQFFLSVGQVGNQLNQKIYPKIADLMQVETSQIADNWALILNFLLAPANGYRLNPAIELNSDNFQGSFGRQTFLYPVDRQIVEYQIAGTKRYQQGQYYQALLCFVKAWNEERNNYKRGNPEICIYINNCLIEERKLFFKHEVKIYTLAVVVPFHHNQGKVAAEILRGVAQIQSQVNFQNIDISSLEKEFCNSIERGINQNSGLNYNIQSEVIKPNVFSVFSNQNNLITSSKFALKVMLINDPNNVYDPYNQTAETLANLASQINLIGVIGHYSTEMTKTALIFYSHKEIVLINASSTSDELSVLGENENIGFFRISTPDAVNAAQLIQYLVDSFPEGSSRKVVIIYNDNSSFSCSYRAAIIASLEQYQNKFELHSEYARLSGEFNDIQTYLTAIQQEGVNIIILIPDGGIEPNSLNNAGLISRLNLNNCIIAGPATFYQKNVLHWMHERSQQNINATHDDQLIACIPWHWHSEENGCHSSNTLAQEFCQIGSQLWGEENVTWRSATAFDAILIILKTLERHQDGESLFIRMRRLFKVGSEKVRGVTGVIRFKENGDRISPPTEIAVVQLKKTLEARQNSSEPIKQWTWVHKRTMPRSIR